MKHRINILATVLLLTGLFVAFITPIKTSAAGAVDYYLTLSASSTSANADGSKITLTAHAYYFKCADLSLKKQGETCSDGSAPTQYARSGKKLFITSSGVTLGGVQSEGSQFYVLTGEDGKAQFTASSSSAGTRQISATLDYAPENGVQTVSLTFKAVAAAPAPAPKPKAPTPAPAPAPEPPKTPEVASMQIAGQDIADKNNITIESNKPFELKGKTVANGVVKLYIFSTPRESTVTADAEGNWTYAIEGLELGSHHVEAEVTDPATQKTSARGTLVAFTVQEPREATPVMAATPTKKTSKAWLLWVIGALLLVASVGLWWWLKKRKQKVPDSDSGAPQPLTASLHEPSQQEPKDDLR